MHTPEVSAEPKSFRLLSIDIPSPATGVPLAPHQIVDARTRSFLTLVTAYRALSTPLIIDGPQ